MARRKIDIPQLFNLVSRSAKALSHLSRRWKKCQSRDLKRELATVALIAGP
jgi:hypothetical protein